MIELAFHHKEELNRQYANMMLNSDKYKYVLARNWITYELNIENNNWNKIQLVSVTHDPYHIHGYFKCDVNRAVHYAYGLVVINFDDKPSLIFANDFKKFLHIMLIVEYKFNKLQFTCVVGNPAEQLYDRLINRYSGRIVGVYKNDVKLLDNEIYDLKLYEITRTAILNNLSAKRRHI